MVQYDADNFDHICDIRSCSLVDGYQCVGDPSCWIFRVEEWILYHEVGGRKYIQTNGFYLPNYIAEDQNLNMYCCAFCTQVFCDFPQFFQQVPALYIEIGAIFSHYFQSTSLIHCIFGISRLSRNIYRWCSTFKWTVKHNWSITAPLLSLNEVSENIRGRSFQLESKGAMVIWIGGLPS